MKKLIFTMLCCLCTVVANAEEYTDENGVTWLYSIYGSSISIDGATGLGENVVCPDVITFNEVEYPVTYIASSIFQSNITIKTVELPDGLTGFGEAAFYNCSSLTSITIPAGVTSIEASAFNGCSSLTSITLPEKVTSIGDNAFYMCTSLTSINIPVGVTSIGGGAFLYCSSLTSITLPSGLTSIRYGTFEGCSKLTSINIPTGVTSIGQYAFRGCSSLTSITLPEGVTNIGEQAFMECSSLTSITLPEKVTSIEAATFYGCSKLTSITLPTRLPRIGDEAFFGCSSLTSITLPAGVTSIGGFAFGSCSSLTSITLSAELKNIGRLAFQGCSKLTSITLPEGVTNIGENAFSECTSLTSINIPAGVTSIEKNTFFGCSSLTSITLPAGVTSIGENAFGGSGIYTIKMEGSTPPSLSSSISTEIIFFVPDQDAYESYCAHADWKGVVAQLTHEEAATQTVTLEANNEVSSLYTAIREENLKFVYDLTINGTINGADIYIMRNKMPVLRKLDLSQARIVSGGGAYYQSYTTEDDVLGAKIFYGLPLYEIELPTQLTSIGTEALASCPFQNIEIPEGVTSIEGNAFSGCGRLRDVSFPKTLKSIEGGAFWYCSSISKIVLPIGLEKIGYGAFVSCHSLQEVRFPSGLKELGAEAFAECNAITDVYAYTVEPVDMTEGTFSGSVVRNATLHYPLTSKYNYYTNGGWGQFLNMEEFDEPYEYFYLNNDYTLNQDNGGVIDGTPDVDINEGGGLIVEDDLNGSTDEDTQHTDNMNIHHNGGHGGDGVGGSIIAGDNLHANKVHFRINVKGGQWHFFAFPFNIKKENIQCEGGADWVFHYYDGQERAKNGKGGWKKVTSEEGQGNFLKAGMGYIFQSSKDDVLVITVDEDNDPDEEGIRFDKENKSNAMEAHASQNEQDASWNFMGNPHLSYYDLDAKTYDAPITVWDGEKYVAVRPGDDEYQLAPFQAFFVQKPNDVDEIEFKRDNQMTHQQKENKAATVSAYARTRSFDGRLIVNITLSDNNHSDNTRVVFNDARKMDYERACDAAKFASAGVPQLYTLDSRKVKYAINERPQEEGSVAMGYSVPAYGSYTIDAPRMDTPMVLKDLLTGIIHDFDEGSYSFASEAGTFDNRFVLMTRAAATGMDIATLGHIQVSATEGGIGVSQLGGATLNVFTTAGEKVASTRTDGVIAVTAGIYMVEADGKSVKVVVK